LALLYRGLSLNPIQKGLEEQPLQFKEPMTRSRAKSLEEQISLKFLMLHETWNSKEMKIMAWSTL